MPSRTATRKDWNNALSLSRRSGDAFVAGSRCGTLAAILPIVATWASQPPPAAETPQLQSQILRSTIRKRVCTTKPHADDGGLLDADFGFGFSRDPLPAIRPRQNRRSRREPRMAHRPFCEEPPRRNGAGGVDRAHDSPDGGR